MFVHAKSWFEIMPKTMPMMVIGWPPRQRRDHHAQRLGGDRRRLDRAADAGLVVATMKRSNAPIFWLLFGAGGMLSALLGTALVFITGLAVPLGWPLPADLLSYPRALAFAQHWFAKGFLFVVIAAVRVARGAPHLPQPARHRRAQRRVGQGGVLWRRAR